MKLGLGSAQFGMSYGVSNTGGQVSFDQVTQILKAAESEGVDLVDTAVDYGQSEEVLGKAFALLNENKFQVVSKFPKIQENVIDHNVVEDLKRQFELSLGRLKQQSLDGLLLHNADDLLKPGADLLYGLLEDLKSKKRIKKIGVSVYHPSQATQLVERYKMDLIQLPMNLLDQRFLLSGCLEMLKQKTIEVHVRSVLLQGLLLMPINQIPSFLHKLTPKLELLETLAQKLAISKLSILLKFIQQTHLVDYVIMGVTTAAEFKELLQAFKQVLHSEQAVNIDWQSFAEYDENLILPIHWRAV